MWPTRSSVPLNTLQFKCMQQITRDCVTPVNHFDQQQPQHRPANWFDESVDDTVSKTSFAGGSLPPITSSIVETSPQELRQQLHDHVVRERAPISADFLCQLLRDGGLRRLDLWTLCEYSEFSRREMQQILDTITLHGFSLQELSIGGGHWMFDSALMNGPMRRLMRTWHVQQLKSLRFQLSPAPSELAVLLQRCSSLQRLDIAQPSISDSQLQWLASHVDGRQLRNLTELCLPSSVRGVGLACALLWLPQLRSLHCSQFESLLDLLDELQKGTASDSFDDENFNEDEDEELSSDDTFHYNRLRRIVNKLYELNTLQVTQPVSADVPARIAHLCPMLHCLRLETQELMRLQPLAGLKRLRSLQLHNCSTLGASYLEHVRPLLIELGSQLTELSLEQFDVIDLNELSSCCPRLCALSVQWFSILSVGRTTGWAAPQIDLLHPAPAAPAELVIEGAAAVLGLPNQDHSFFFTLPARLKHQSLFANLRCLRLRPRVHQPLHLHLLEFVVCNAPRLLYIEVYGLVSGGDVQWQRMLACPCNGWARLKYLIVRHGHELSDRCVTQLLRLANELMHLEVEKPPLSKTDLLPNGPEEDEF